MEKPYFLMDMQIPLKTQHFGQQLTGAPPPSYNRSEPASVNFISHETVNNFCALQFKAKDTRHAHRHRPQKASPSTITGFSRRPEATITTCYGKINGEMSSTADYRTSVDICCNKGILSFTKTQPGDKSVLPLLDIPTAKLLSQVTAGVTSNCLRSPEATSLDPREESYKKITSFSKPVDVPIRSLSGIQQLLQCSYVVQPSNFGSAKHYCLHAEIAILIACVSCCACSAFLSYFSKVSQVVKAATRSVHKMPITAPLKVNTVSITGMNCNGKYPAKHYTDSFGFEEEKSNIMNSEIKKPHFPPGEVSKERRNEVPSLFAYPSIQDSLHAYQLITAALFLSKEASKTILEKTGKHASEFQFSSQETKAPRQQRASPEKAVPERRALGQAASAPGSQGNCLVGSQAASSLSSQEHKVKAPVLAYSLIFNTCGYDCLCSDTSTLGEQIQATRRLKPVDAWPEQSSWILKHQTCYPQMTPVASSPYRHVLSTPKSGRCQCELVPSHIHCHKHDPIPAEAGGKISVADSGCQTDIRVTPWSHPAAEQHQGRRNQGFKIALLAQTGMNPMNFKMKFKGICWLLSITAMSARATWLHQTKNSPTALWVTPQQDSHFDDTRNSVGHHSPVTLDAFGMACSPPGHCSVLSQQDVESGEAPEVLQGENCLWACNASCTLHTCLLALLLGCAGVCEWFLYGILIHTFVMQISVWYPDTKAPADALSPLHRRRSSRTQQAQGIRMKLRPIVFMHKTWRDEDAGMAGPRQLPTAFSPLPGASPGAAAGLPGWEKGVPGGSGDGHCPEPWTWPHACSGCGRGSVDTGPGDGGSAVFFLWFGEKRKTELLAPSGMPADTYSYCSEALKVF
ncbi:hypothetical protein Anapl_13677 [Anas platyrhynchos]|uniref:Uncharacterized protein n=1 Tax=Anas platyrhynchos TaxID=8839 RepID=R0LB87_ANAPL|nr:hypothetical protein Anapl_13677 [Anas platyrhynchos]